MSKFTSLKKSIFYKNHLKNQKGMTLIEIMIVLGIIASLMVFGASVIGTPRNNMKEVSKNLVRVIRYVYNQAALNNRYYRIVFDLNEQKYFVEYSDSPFYVVKENDEIEAIRIQNEERESKFDTELTAPETNSGASFAESEDDLLEIFKLPDNIKFTSIYVEHQADKIEEGKAYLYFFPKGHAEFAVIHISGESEDDVITLVVNPLTANVKIEMEDIDHETLLRNMGQF